ncbi:peptidylprolyl isomerase [Aeromicrobium sp. SMF47]|uniref:Peptidyl-prolyl cis-trans isomerase n=1 Tax=Aeromicrobium yanjiei TaxID=2662028 RepID=A0A5Q2MIQ8_9ACTN|nr:MULTISPECIES: peptidylprolyl isomerase [Aeromicrobium]MRJ77214.1 peptidylprolyl isomerase [Aeromicrobium yanjiei]MRK01581.1 peptidylprolyl isomerase [Aeromicrobium sp. S22]QGG41651.1 peptidylprolyl isomerase [Aeromicrobium yanjiei]
MRSRLLAATASVLLVSLLAACGGSDDDDKGSDTSSAKPESSATTSAPAGGGSCTYKKVSEPGKKAELPPSTPKAADEVTITTNRGDIKATLTPESAPCTVSSFVSLAEQGYFDGTKCHRLVPGFVLQCGDPSATGTGGPGYSFADELKGDETYPAGTLAMANAGPDTNGSQFFIVLADSDLPASYTVFGKVDDAGLAVAKEIEKDGNASDGVSPAKDVVIESVS